MAAIRVISTSTVQAHSHSVSTHRIDLNAWDLQFLLTSPIQKGLLFHKPNPFSSDNTLISCLKSSLSETLQIFPPLAGELAVDEREDGAVSYYVVCNNAGALFVHTAADGITVNDILKAVNGDEVYSFFALNGVLSCEGTSKPLLAAQVTELDDGIFIGCTLNHAGFDGTCFWDFFNTWSGIARGHPPRITLKDLTFDRWFLAGTQKPIWISPAPKKQMMSSNFVPKPFTERVFHFTKENVRKLKSKANGEMGTNKVSSFQAIFAHMWRSTVRYRNVARDEDVHCVIFIGARQRLKSEIPEKYFGSAVQSVKLTMKAGELLDNELGQAAMRINEVVAMHTEEKLKESYKSWVEDPKPLTLGEVAKNAIYVSSSPRFDVYGNDFGWGKPVAVRSGAGNKAEGKMTVFCGAEEGSVDVEACLSPETAEGMENDAEFMEVVKIYG